MKMDLARADCFQELRREGPVGRVIGALIIDVESEEGLWEEHSGIFDMDLPTDEKRRRQAFEAFLTLPDSQNFLLHGLPLLQSVDVASGLLVVDVEFPDGIPKLLGEVQECRGLTHFLGSEFCKEPSWPCCNSRHLQLFEHWQVPQNWRC